MAVLTSAQVVPQFLQGGADIVGLYGLRNVNTGDTIDVSTISSSPSFQVVKRAVVIGVSDFVEIAAAFAGAVVTMPAGMAASSGYLLIWGC